MLGIKIVAITSDKPMGMIKAVQSFMVDLNKIKGRVESKHFTHDGKIYTCFLWCLVPIGAVQEMKKIGYQID